MSDSIEPTLDNCGCCETDPVPPLIYNRPGLPALAYRAGTYATIFRRMLNRIGKFTLQDGDFAGTRPLAALTTREQDDPSIALLDVSAVMADVLTFYQERIANEGFLRTATERRSILEMAREIGYELSPGVAASVYLSFTVDEAPGAPGVSTIPAGTKVQSIPPQGKLPQPFETSQELIAYKEWNALHPRLTYKQTVDTSTTEVYLQGTSTNLNPGDRLLLVDAEGTPVLVQAIAVEAQADQKRTRVDFFNPAALPEIPGFPSSWGSVDINSQVPLNQDNVGQYIYALKWTDSDLNAFLDFNQWDLKQLRSFLSNDRVSNPASEGSIYALRKSVGFFGNSAPAYASLPSGGDVTTDYGRKWDEKGHLTVNYWNGSSWNWADQGTPSGTAVAGAPAVVTYLEAGTERIYAFAQGANGHLFLNYWNGSAWNWVDQGTPAGTLVTDALAAITYLDGTSRRIYAFARGTNGHLLVNYYDGSKWNWADQGAPTGTLMTGTPAVITYLEAGKQRIYAFLRGVNGKLYVNYWNGTQWHWAKQGTYPGTTLAGSPAAITYLDSGKQRIYAFARGANGHLLVNYWNGTAWHWADQGTLSGTEVTDTPGVITYLESGKQRIYAFVRGANGHLAVNYWNGTAWHWADQGTPSGTTLACGPGVITYLESGTQRIYAFVQGVNGHLSVNYWNGSGWNWADQGIPSDTTGTGTPGVITYLEAGEQRIYAFAQSANGWQIWMDQQAGQDDDTDPTLYYHPGADVYLERVVQGLVKDFGQDPRSWAAFETPNDNQVYLVDSLVEKSLGAFAMSGKSTGLRLKNFDGSTITKPSSFLVRNTTAYMQSEQLSLVEVPLDETLDSDPAKLVLDGLALGLTIGQAIVLSGERSDAPGITVSEVLILSDINHLGGFTELTFQTGRQNEYIRSTVSINANTVTATHGETVNEILGSGDGAQVHQKFTLKKPPLTYTPSPTPSGSASTLQLRVNNLLWDEAASLYSLGAKDQDYIIRIDNDGKPTILFGDGDKGARLPTGQNNVTATYRSGIGLAGEVDAGSLTLLPSKPFGVRSVVNPLAASGAGDPENMDDARSNAPLTVRTLDRIVSREDYEDFAAAFAGIGKAQAIDLWNGEHHLVHVTIAGEDGEPVDAGLFRDNFIKALHAARDPSQHTRVDTFDLLLFNLVANVSIDSRYISTDVLSEITSALTEAFAFAQRAFGQPVTAAEVITVIQKVAGVVYVDLDSLYLFNDTPGLNQILLSNIAHVENGVIQKAQLLLLNTLGIKLQEVSA